MSLKVPERFQFLYTCLGCGFVSTQNFRDSHCPVCKNAGDVAQLKITQPQWELYQFTSEPAPHTLEDD